MTSKLSVPRLAKGKPTSCNSSTKQEVLTLVQKSVKSLSVELKHSTRVSARAHEPHFLGLYLEDECPESFWSGERLLCFKGYETESKDKRDPGENRRNLTKTILYLMKTS